MPDENTNSVWTTQTSQNNQATTKQTWDDFVLDFWEKESEKSEWTTDVEVNLDDKTNEDNGDGQDFTDLNFDDENVFSEESEESESEDNENFTDFQWENTDDDMNIDISLNDESNDESSDEIWQENEEWTQFEDEEKNEIGNEENEDIEEVNIEDDFDQQDTKNEENLEDNEENLDTDLYSEDTGIDEDNDIDDEINENYVEEQIWDDVNERDESQIVSDNSDSEEGERVSDIDQFGDEEKIEDSEEVNETEDDIIEDSFKESADSMEDSNTELNEDNAEFNEDLDEWGNPEKSDEETMGYQENEDSQETNLLDDAEEKTMNDNQNIDTMVSPSDNNILDSDKEKDWWYTEPIFKEKPQDEDGENMDIDTNENNSETKESLNQPEKTDLLWNNSENPAEIDTENDTDTNVTNFELDVNPADKQENFNVVLDTIEWKDDSTQTTQENNTETSQENPSFILDYQEDDKSNNNTNHIILDNNTVWNNNYQNWNEESQSDIDYINNTTSSYNNTWNTSIENEVSNTGNFDSWNQDVVQSINIDINNDTMSQPETHQIASTLSLDQILDSELNDNPQFADNSHSVPRNVPLNSWSLVKKVVWIFAWIGIVALAGYFIFLKSPNDNFGNQPEPTEITEDYIDDTIDHSSALDDTIESTEEDFMDSDSHPAKSTIEQESLEEDRGDEDLEDLSSEAQDSWKPEPYVCEDGYCIDEPDFPDIETAQEIQPWDVLQVISNYKLQAESYYSQLDEMQGDKLVIKYSLQAIHLCDVYQEQIENGEWLDDESLSSFTSNIDWLFAKIEEYRSWNTMDEKEKEEMKNFIYQRANW